MPRKEPIEKLMRPKICAENLLMVQKFQQELTANCCMTMAYRFYNNQHGQDLDLKYMFKSFFNREGIRFRNEQNNIVIGAIVSKSLASLDRLYIGLSYVDKKDNDTVDEDLFLICDYKIQVVKPKNIKTQHPEYLGTHHGPKPSLRTLGYVPVAKIQQFYI